MENIQKNKSAFLSKMGYSLDVTKSKDVLEKDSVKVHDILNGKESDKKINKMSDIFPQSSTSNNDLLS